VTTSHGAEQRVISPCVVSPTPDAFGWDAPPVTRFFLPLPALRERAGVREMRPNKTIVPRRPGRRADA